MAAHRSGEQRRRGRDLGPHDLLVIEQAVAVRREQIRQQHEPIALGQQHEQLRRTARRMPSALGDRARRLRPLRCGAAPPDSSATCASVAVRVDELRRTPSSSRSTLTGGIGFA